MVCKQNWLPQHLNNVLHGAIRESVSCSVHYEQDLSLIRTYFAVKDYSNVALP